MIAYTHYETDPRVIREAEAAVNGGFDVDFLALRRKDDPDAAMIRGVRVLRLNQYRYRGGGHGRYLLAYLELFARCFFKCTFLFLRKRYRVIHVNNMPDFLVWCTLIPRLFGARILLDIHDPMPNTFASKFKSGENGFFFKILLWQELISAWYANAVLTVSEPLKQHILIKHGIPADKIHVIANFADDRLFTLRKLPTVNGRIRIIFHGTILERNGLRDLIVALSKTKGRQNLLVRIIGEGDFSQPLIDLIRLHGLEEVVQFENRVYPLLEIPDIVASCHVGVVPLEISSITNYALPLKLLEYISLGLPVITVRNTAIAHYLNEGDCLFFQPGSTDSLRDIFERIASQPNTLLAWHERSTALREKFLWSDERNKYVRLLNDLCPKRKENRSDEPRNQDVEESSPRGTHSVRPNRDEFQEQADRREPAGAGK